MSQSSAVYDPGSFRDPSGRVFRQDGAIFRTVTHQYAETYNKLITAGLFAELQNKGLLVSHTEDKPLADCYKVIRPEVVPFISYPFEWCFSQLKDAAILTLNIQQEALKKGFVLKDSSAYNVQFINNRPIFIDSLSFATYSDGAPWEGYKQFCQHFLAPLALVAYKDVRLQGLLKLFLDGIPLDLASALLPLRSYLSPSLLFHIHLHARTQTRYADLGRSGAVKKRVVSKNGLLGVLDSLKDFISSLEWKPKGTEWADYYEDNNYTEVGFDEKSKVLDRFIRTAAPKSVWDIGANAGHFSAIAHQAGAESVVSFDIDPAATEKHYRRVRRKPGPFPLIMDLTNPTSSYGWDSAERSGFKARGPVDCVLALALVHHLAISNNLPLEMIAASFKDLCQYLIIEFVPKEDSQVRRLLASREDIFPNYTKDGFEGAFLKYFKIEKQENVETSKRTLYLMSAK